MSSYGSTYRMRMDCHVDSDPEIKEAERKMVEEFQRRVRNAELLLWKQYNKEKQTMGYRPTFEPQATVTNQNVGGKPFVNNLNMDYFATVATAKEMASLFGADHIKEIPYPGGSGGDLSTDAPPQRILVWKDGLEMNAGKLATFWVRNPEDEFPGLAFKLATRSVQDTREFYDMMKANGS